MVVNGQHIQLSHMVSFSDNTVFVAGRENRRLRLFLINERTGNVYAARNAEWTELYGAQRTVVIDTTSRAREAHTIPCYRSSGTLDAKLN